jgi:hypothetical protein
MTFLYSPSKTAVGSSYGFDQTPGGERYGGLTLKIRRPSAGKGTIIIKPTDQRTGRMNQDFVKGFGKEAEKGVRDAARELGVNLDEVDVEVSYFAYHTVDSPPSIYYGAARSAFRSAWEAWHRYHTPPANGSLR